MLTQRLRGSWLAVALTLLAADASAQTMVGPTDNVEAIFNGLSPGDEVILTAGDYPLNGQFGFRAIGTAAQPIVIRAAAGAAVRFHRPNANENIWEIEDVAYLTLRGIEFSGGSAGLRVQNARYFTIEDCEIHSTGDVALRFNDSGATYDNIQILRNHIHDTHGTGEGMYLGCNLDGCRMSNSLIAGNYVHHTNAGDVDQGDGIELKEGSFGNIIRDNVIHDTKFPCITGYATLGNGAANVVERNLLFNCGDHGIQWAANVRIRNNIVLSAVGSGIASQPHQSADPQDLEIVFNTVVVPDGPAVSVRQPAATVVVANNALYAQSGAAILARGNDSRIVAVANVGVGGLDGLTTNGYAAGDVTTDFVAANYSGGVPNGVFPASGGALVGVGDPTYLVTDDFNETVRQSRAIDVGAYVVGNGINPGWTLAETFKPAPGVPPTPDAGIADTGVTSDVGSSVDSGPAPDAGSAPADAGSRDAGGPTADGGVTMRDAGSTPKTAEEPIDESGCACLSTSHRERSSPWLALVLLGLASRVTRRRMR